MSTMTSKCSVALRAARLAEISAETAEWIAADLEREAGDDDPRRAAAERIRARAEVYRVDAGRLRSVAGSGALPAPV